MDKKINTLTKKIDYNNLTYYFKTKSNPVSLSNFICSLGLKRNVIDCYLDLEKAKINK